MKKDNLFGGGVARLARLQRVFIDEARLLFLDVAEKKQEGKR
jgi:hypothetical protein